VSRPALGRPGHALGRPRLALGRAGLALAAAATLAAAGCGSTPPPSLIQLRAQATRICATASRQIGTIGTPPSEAGGEAFLKRGIAVLAPELRRLRSLAPPGEAAAVYTAAIGALSGQLDALRQATHALRQREDPVIAFKTLQHRLAPLENQANGAWQALQIPTCQSV
jgi:hypothetical protein